jgi:hypothetical protein
MKFLGNILGLTTSRKNDILAKVLGVSLLNSSQLEKQ